MLASGETAALYMLLRQFSFAGGIEILLLLSVGPSVFAARLASSSMVEHLVYFTVHVCNFSVLSHVVLICLQNFWKVPFLFVGNAIFIGLHYVSSVLPVRRMLHIS